LKLSIYISSQLYVGNPQFYPVAENASGGAPVLVFILNNEVFSHVSMDTLFTPIGISPFKISPLERQ